MALSPDALAALSGKTKFRFVVGSDGHYGENGTPSEDYYNTAVHKIGAFHAINPLSFCVINGDIIHDDGTLLPKVKPLLDKLPVKYYVTKGNHDKVSDERWHEVWGMPVNFDVRVGKQAILCATTSDEQGRYLSPDIAWLEQALATHRKAKNVFLFLHIPQGKWSANAIETPEFFEVLKKFSNVRAVFHGHEHDMDGVKIVDNVPYLWDSHIGGSWGTAYRGFRVVELTDSNQLLTYIMNPTERINQAVL